MQLDIMLFFQSLRTPMMEAVAEIASMFGEIAIPLVTIMILIWCVSRKKAFALSSALLSGLLVTQTVKSICRFPRPFQVHPDLITGGRLETATGYSFPSGHSTTSGAFYSSLIFLIWKRWATLLLIIPIILVPLSRMVLGVHWPLDVTVGTIIGLVAGLLMTPLMLRLYDARRPFLIFTFIYGLLAAALATVLAVMLQNGSIDSIAFDDLMSNAAITGGVMLGFYGERKAVASAPEKGSLPRKAARFIVGLLSTAAVAAIIAIVPAPEYFTSFMLYFMLGLWCTLIYPAIAVKMHLMEAEGKAAR